MRASLLASIALIIALGGAAKRLAPDLAHVEPATVELADLEPARVEPAQSPRIAMCPAELPPNMACIPGGTFTRGADDDEANARPAAPITVSSFLLDTREVTNAQWSECVVAGACRRLTPFRGYGAPEQPAVGMRWDEAVAFCERRGARLPTEAEWERAASGPSDTRYPWGDAAPSEPCSRAVVRIQGGGEARGRGCGTGTTLPVASRPADAYGLYDMSGNVWEWVQDAYSECYAGCARECGAQCAGLDPRGPCGGAAECAASRGLRVVRGGSWWHHVDRAEVHDRRGVPAANPNPHRFGFRCAAELPTEQGSSGG